MDAIKKIVVGVDQSEGARLALAWALRESVDHQAAVEVVSVYETPRPSAASYGHQQPEAADETGEVAAGAVRRLVDEVSAEVPGGFAQAGVEVSTVEGKPTDVLLAAADDADLLVVGHGGRGGLARILLGSVAQQCVERATCPVTVVRPTRTATASDADFVPA